MAQCGSLGRIYQFSKTLFFIKRLTRGDKVYSYVNEQGL